MVQLPSLAYSKVDDVKANYDVSDARMGAFQLAA